MPIGRKSLERVASGGAEAVVLPDTESVAEPVTAPAAPVETAPAVKPKKASEAKKATVAKPDHAIAKCTNKTYAIGDKLPEYLL